MRIKKAILKISGEVLAGEKGIGVDEGCLSYVAREISSCQKTGVQIAVIVGGGNFFRGAEEKISLLNRVEADLIGITATVMNALLLKGTFDSLGIHSKVFSRVAVEKIAERYTVEKANQSLSDGKITLIAGGTGNPFFTTDTAAALAAAELNAGVLIKATKVDGVYSKDPMKYKDAKKYDFITYEEAISRKLKIMDISAFSLCMERHIKIMVLNLRKRGNILNALTGKKVGTTVGG
ncbi:MAG: UMP kinase [Elusimicrobiota bacterium]